MFSISDPAPLSNTALTHLHLLQGVYLVLLQCNKTLWNLVVLSGAIILLPLVVPIRQAFCGGEGGWLLAGHFWLKVPHWWQSDSSQSPKNRIWSSPGQCSLSVSSGFLFMWAVLGSLIAQWPQTVQDWAVQLSSASMPGNHHLF